MAETIKIGGRLHSTATGNIVTGANEVFDDSKDKKQSEINQELSERVNDKEDKSNKVTSISSGSTDTQYASAKAVYVAVNEEEVRATFAELNLNNDISKCFNSVSYSSTTETKEIIFKHDDTIVARLDAKQFIKDGMVDNVEVVDGYLVITFNTDAGKEDIRITLSDIFDPNNYYDKTAIDGLLGDKEDKSNKVTSISSGSTDTQYASAKAVYTIVKNEISKIYYSDIRTEDITEGQLTGEIKSKLITLRVNADLQGAKFIALKGGATDVLAVVKSYGSTFDMWFIDRDKLCEVTATSDDLTWSAHWEEFEKVTNKVTSITSGSTDTQYASAKAVYTNISSKYTKPSGGIPKSDLDNSVQESLGKADTAVQSADIENKEDKSNKVTSITSGSTDEQYASAKAVYREISKTYYVDFDFTQIQEGQITDEGIIAQLNKIRVDALNENIQLILFHNSNTYSYKSMIASIENDDELFDIMISSGRAYLVFEYRYSNQEWSCVMREMEVTSNMVQTITSDSRQHEYPSAKAVYTIVNNKEDKSNKVTSITSGSTDEQYASAKAVYNSIKDFTSGVSEFVTLNGPELPITQDGTYSWLLTDEDVRLYASLEVGDIIGYASIGYGAEQKQCNIIVKYIGSSYTLELEDTPLEHGEVTLDNPQEGHHTLTIGFNTSSLNKISSLYIYKVPRKGEEFEKVSNKVTSIYSGSTDEQYASAKAVYTIVNDKEDKSNKVTSISSGSTDTQYASAKAVYTVVKDEISKIYYSDIQISDITEGELTGTVKTKLQALRTGATISKFVILATSEIGGNRTGVVATIDSYGSTFQMWFVYQGRYCEVTATPDDSQWSAHWEEFEKVSNKVTSISSSSSDTQYPSARAVYTNVNAKYTKPSGGIPKSDLDSSVQESLDKANSAATQSYVDEIANSTELVLLDGEAFPVYVLESPTTYSWELKNEDLYTYYNIESGGKLFGFLACSLNNTDYKIDIKAINSSTQIYLDYVNLPDAFIYYLSQPYITRPSTTYGHGRINIPVDSIQSGDSLILKGLYLYRVPQYIFEESKNKVTLIASDNTDEQYPSAKSVYTSVSVKYTKPYDGIPKTDLESTVQSSLDNADTAVQPSELYTYVNNCEYDNVTHEIRLLNGSRTIATIDASEFIIDGMISNVTISGTNLVITFNTISGSTQTISIPIADIFQPDNYYTKDEIDKIAYYSDINTEDITEGEITGATKTKLQALRTGAAESKIVILSTPDFTGNRTGVVATIDRYGSEFQMWFVDKNRLCQITATPDDSYWSAHWETLATETYVNNTLPKEISTTSERVVMKPNNLYKLGVRGALEVVFRQGNPGYVNEYMFEFTSNTDSFSLTVPSGVKWLYEPEITSGNTYQVSILNNLAVIAEWVNE